MKKFYKENLDLPLKEPKSKAAAEAKQLGLKYVGFGRYENPEGQVTHIVQDDRLVPYDKATKTRSYKDFSDNDLSDYAENLQDEDEATHGAMVENYPPEAFDEEEIEAIQAYTGPEYDDIQDRLWSQGGESGVMPMNSSDPIPQTIKKLDRIMKRHPLKQPITTYAAVAAELYNNLKPGVQFINRGYRSTTISLQQALEFGGALPPEQQGRDMNQRASMQDTVILQIKMKKGQAGLYVDELSEMAGEREFILPRETKFKVLSGPNKLVGNTKLGRSNVVFYEVEIA